MLHSVSTCKNLRFGWGRTVLGAGREPLGRVPSVIRHIRRLHYKAPSLAQSLRDRIRPAQSAQCTQQVPFQFYSGGPMRIHDVGGWYGQRNAVVVTALL